MIYKQCDPTPGLFYMASSVWRLTILYLIPLPDFIAVPLGEIVCRTWWLHTQAEKGQNKTTLSTQFSNNRVLIQKDFGSHDKTHICHCIRITWHNTILLFVKWWLLICVIDCLKGQADVGHQLVNVSSVPSRRRRFDRQIAWTHEK